MPLSKRLTEEIAASIDDARYYLFNNIPQSPDETLTSLLGGDVDRYDLILKDAHASAALEKRVRNVALREWNIEPGGTRSIDKQAVKTLETVLRQFDSDQMIVDLMINTLLKGNGFIELKWAIEGKLTYVGQAICRPVYRFTFLRPGGTARNSKLNSLLPYEASPVNDKQRGYFKGYEIRVLKLNDIQFGEPVPPMRILCHNYGQIADNPWGVGLGQVLYWLAVVFKKEIIKQRLIYLDKYAQPTLLATANETATREQRDAVLNVLQEITQGGYGVLPYGWVAEFLEASRSSTNDVFQGGIDWLNQEMSKCVLGETLSLELPGSSGSRAASETHADQSGVFLAKYDSDRLASGPLREFSQWVTNLNHPGAKAPMMWKRFPEFEEMEDLNSRVNRDNTLKNIGYTITPKKVEEVYGEGYEKQEEDKGFGSGFEGLGGEGEAADNTDIEPDFAKFSEPLNVEGNVLPQDTFDKIAEVGDEDIEEAIAQWKEIAPERYENLLNT